MAITSDNALLNRNVTKFLTENFTRTFYPSPNIPEHKIFIMKDAPHFIKSVRNCWLNLRNPLKTFVFPPFKDLSFGRDASFKFIRDLFDSEKEKCMKLGFKLTYSSVYPSSIERQKVPLALKIFDQTTSAAVETVFPERAGLFNFLRLIDRVWKCFNVNTTSKGLFLNDPDCRPFKHPSDCRLKFLRDFADWLDEWKEETSNYGKLSSQTFFSLSFSSRSLADAIEYLLCSCGYNFVLTATFSSDCIEGLFGIYRQSVGRSFHMTHDQAQAIEKKMRMKSSIELQGKIIKLDDSLPLPSADSFVVYDSIDIDFSQFAEFDENEKESAYYLGVYNAKKLSKTAKCKTCLNSFRLSHEDKDADFAFTTYFDAINRGRLTMPRLELVHIVLKCSRFFDKYLGEHIGVNQVSLSCLIELFFRLLEDIGDLDSLPSCADHPDGVGKLLDQSSTIFSKVSLKNFTQFKNDQSKSEKPKLAKLSRNDGELQK